MHIPASAKKREERLQAYYYKYLLSFDLLQVEERQALAAKAAELQKLRRDQDVAGAGSSDKEGFGFENGRAHTLSSFAKFADEFKRGWFKHKVADHLNVTPSEIEREYWRILEAGDEHVSVLYGSDVDSTVHGSGFATDMSDPYSRFGWNLNVLPGLPESLLRRMTDGISGISLPWLYVGMVFGTFCWHVEDNFLYSINYMHFGEGKRWYGVPSCHAELFEETFREEMPGEFQKNPRLLHDIVTMVGLSRGVFVAVRCSLPTAHCSLFANDAAQLSPEKLAAKGVRVCSTVQEPGQFVVTFPRVRPCPPLPPSARGTAASTLPSSATRACPRTNNAGVPLLC